MGSSASKQEAAAAAAKETGTAATTTPLRARYVRSQSAPNAQCEALAATNGTDEAQTEVALLRQSFGRPTQKTAMVEQWVFPTNDPFAEITVVNGREIVFSILFPASTSDEDRRRMGAILNTSQAYRYDRALQRLMVTCNAGYANVGMLALATSIMKGEHDYLGNSITVALANDARTKLLAEYIDRSKAATHDRDVVEFVDSKRVEWEREFGIPQQQVAHIAQFRSAVDTF